MTPGIAIAADASIAPILAWGWGLRTIATCAMPGMFRSSTYIDDPVIRRGSSLRRTSAPTSRLRTMGTLLSRYAVPCRLPARTLTLDQTAEHSTVQHSRDDCRLCTSDSSPVPLSAAHWAGYPRSGWRVGG